jgi:hypothetical protein
MSRLSKTEASRHLLPLLTTDRLLVFEHRTKHSRVLVKDPPTMSALNVSRSPGLVVGASVQCKMEGLLRNQIASDVLQEGGSQRPLPGESSIHDSIQFPTGVHTYQFTEHVLKYYPRRLLSDPNNFRKLLDLLNPAKCDFIKHTEVSVQCSCCCLVLFLCLHSLTTI